MKSKTTMLHHLTLEMNGTTRKREGRGGGGGGGHYKICNE